MFNISKVVIFVMPLLLVACASQPAPSKNSQAAATSSPSEPAVSADRVNETAGAPQAVLSLIKRSQQQVNNKNLKGATISLERAIRISPRYPDSYYWLAEVRYLEEQYTLARSLAKKTLSLGAQDSLLENVLVLLEKIHQNEAQ